MTEGREEEKYEDTDGRNYTCDTWSMIRNTEVPLLEKLGVWVRHFIIFVTKCPILWLRTSQHWTRFSVSVVHDIGPKARSVGLRSWDKNWHYDFKQFTILECSYSFLVLEQSCPSISETSFDGGRKKKDSVPVPSNTRTSSSLDLLFN